MYEYHIDKRIDQLDPIPGLDKWTEEQRQHFIDEGVIPIAGPTPQMGADPATKKITVEELYTNLSSKDSVMMLDSASALTTDGTFTLNKLYSAGPTLTVDGTDIQLPPGWYRYGARVTFAFDGETPLNKCEVITLASNLHGTNQQAKINFDFSFAHTEPIYLGALIYNDGAITGPNRVSDTEPLNSYKVFNLSLSGISAAGASGITATLVMEIQSVRVND
jgi:hypothetical protein